MWFSAELIFATVTDPLKGQPEALSWEERIYLIDAQNRRDARCRAEDLGRRLEQSYKSATDELVHEKFVKCVHIFEIFDDQIRDGTELFSRFNEKAPDSLCNPDSGQASRGLAR
jgi:hypothetical protein